MVDVMLTLGVINAVLEMPLLRSIDDFFIIHVASTRKERWWAIDLKGRVWRRQQPLVKDKQQTCDLNTSTPTVYL